MHDNFIDSKIRNILLSNEKNTYKWYHIYQEVIDMIIWEKLAPRKEETYLRIQTYEKKKRRNLTNMKMCVSNALHTFASRIAYYQSD